MQSDSASLIESKRQSNRKRRNWINVF